jgi:hypothetical protein
MLTNGPQRFLTKLLGKLKTNHNRQKNNKALSILEEFEKYVEENLN